jgi:hypothetical protein
MTGPLQGQNVLAIGRGSGLARTAVLAARNAWQQSSRPAGSRKRWTPPTPASLTSPPRSWI